MISLGLFNITHVMKQTGFEQVTGKEGVFEWTMIQIYILIEYSPCYYFYFYFNTKSSTFSFPVNIK
jgi:hypothetical protein